MSGERHYTLVDELERDLQQALALEPSPDFMRQVRARIEQRSTRRMHGLSWMAAAAAVVCATAAGAVWMMQRTPSDVRVASVTGADVNLDYLQPRAAQDTPQPARAPRSRRADRPAEVAEPEIIVPADRARGLARLLALARSGEMDEELLRPVVATSVPETLDVAPLIVPSISIPLVDMKTGAPRSDTARE